MRRFAHMVAQFPGNKPVTTAGKLVHYDEKNRTAFLIQEVNGNTSFLLLDLNGMTRGDRTTILNELNRANRKSCFAALSFAQEDSIHATRSSDHPDQPGAVRVAFNADTFSSRLQGAQSKDERPITLAKLADDHECAKTPASLEHYHPAPNPPTIPLGWFHLGVGGDGAPHPENGRWLFAGAQVVKTAKTGKRYLFLRFLIHVAGHVAKVQEVLDVPPSAEVILNSVEQGMPATPFYMFSKEFVTSSKFLKDASKHAPEGELRMFGQVSAFNFSALSVDQPNWKWNNSTAQLNITAHTIVFDTTPDSLTPDDVLKSCHFITPAASFVKPRLGTKPPVHAPQLLSRWNENSKSYGLEMKYHGSYLSLRGDNCNCFFQLTDVRPPALSRSKGKTEYSRLMIPSQLVQANVVCNNVNDPALSQSVASSIYISDPLSHIRQDCPGTLSFHMDAVQYQESANNNTYGSVPVSNALGFSLITDDVSQLYKAFTFPSMLASHHTIQPFENLKDASSYVVNRPPTDIVVPTPVLQDPVVDTPAEPKQPVAIMYVSDSDEEVDNNANRALFGANNNNDAGNNAAPPKEGANATHTDLPGANDAPIGLRNQQTGEKRDRTDNSSDLPKNKKK